MKRIFAVLLTLALLIACCTGCGHSSNTSENSSPKEDINIASITGPTGVGMANLMDKNDKQQAKNNYHFSLVNSPDEIVAKMSNGEADIAAIPTNLAASLYNKTEGKTRMLAVNTMGVLYILENGNTIKTVDDLKGKTIYSIGQGANPEYILDYILQKHNLQPGKDVTIQFVPTNDELATLMQSGKAEIAMVPEPTVSIIQNNNQNIRTALNITDEWNAISDGKSSLLMGCVIANQEYVDAHSDAVASFLEEYRTSIEDAKAHVEETAQLCEKYGIIAKAEIAQSAIPRCNLTYMDGAYMKSQIEEYFQVLFDANPKSIGGNLPSEEFYYKA